MTLGQVNGHEPLFYDEHRRAGIVYSSAKSVEAIMRRVVIAVLFASCVSATAFGQSSVEITLKHGSPIEAQTRDQLQRLLRTYDVSRWIFTRSIVIDDKAIPFSNPVLTLHARHLRDDELLLSTFVHEEIHWFFVQRARETQDAIKDLHEVFPTVPTSGPEGASGERSTYLHLMVCDLEYVADQQLLGELKARQVMDFWATDHYTWIYATVLTHRREIEKVMSAHKLMLDMADPRREQ